MSFVFPDEGVTFYKDCCEWAKSTSGGLIRCRHCVRPLFQHKHYHAPVTEPESGETFKKHIDTTVAFCSPHCILAHRKMIRGENTYLIHRLLHQMMGRYHHKTTWVWPSTPITACRHHSNDPRMPSAEDLHQHLIQGHLVQVLSPPHHIPGYQGKLDIQ